jgi:hypothetical protein
MCFDFLSSCIAITRPAAGKILNYVHNLKKGKTHRQTGDFFLLLLVFLLFFSSPAVLIRPQFRLNRSYLSGPQPFNLECGVNWHPFA